MTNVNLVRAKMAEAGSVVFAKDLAAILGIAEVTARNKLSGKTPFKSGEIQGFQKAYKLTPEEVQKIFFDE